MGDIGHMPLAGQESYQEMFYSGKDCGLATGKSFMSNGRQDGTRNNVHTVIERPGGKGKHSKGKVSSSHKPRNRKK